MNDINFNDGWNNPRLFENHQFIGNHIPHGFDFEFPKDISPEEYDELFSKRVREFYNHHIENETDSKKEKLQPLSIRVKPHTKQFLKQDSILSAREILELYEDFNNGSELFINSLLEDEKQLQEELEKIQEKLQNAKLFKEKLSEIKKDEK